MQFVLMTDLNTSEFQSSHFIYEPSALWKPQEIADVIWGKGKISPYRETTLSPAIKNSFKLNFGLVLSFLFLPILEV